MTLPPNKPREMTGEGAHLSEIGVITDELLERALADSERLNSEPIRYMYFIKDIHRQSLIKLIFPPGEWRYWRRQQARHRWNRPKPKWINGRIRRRG